MAKFRSLVLVPISVNTLIDEVTWASSWRRSKGATSSSISSFHFGHYIAGAVSEYFPTINSITQLTLALMRDEGHQSIKMATGWACMLKKKVGSSSRLVPKFKLRTISQLQLADLNKANKFIYVIGWWTTIANTTSCLKRSSGRQMMMDDGALAKILFFDIYRGRGATSFNFVLLLLLLRLMRALLL